MYLGSIHEREKKIIFEKTNFVYEICDLSAIEDRKLYIVTCYVLKP